ncbi:MULTISPECIES: hypothetical protein [unclassified Streptomyces]|uniref:hypothetical protein n=1 Tax=unclassified Streptomyces TaxID=2593676 RepID=UPI002E12FAC1|nr:hypothetical protein OG609_44785 [Streptomyces sp. NBC_01224]
MVQALTSSIATKTSDTRCLQTASGVSRLERRRAANAVSGEEAVEASTLLR